MLSYFTTGDVLDCPKSFPSNFDKLIRDYYEIVEKWYAGKFSQNVTAETFGFSDKLNYDIINDFNYLLLLYIITYLERLDAEHASGCPVLADTFIVSSKLDCVRDHFKCIGFDIKELNSIFKLVDGNLDGIGNMAIEGDECGSPEFEIT